MINSPLVSIIMPAFNASPFIGLSIQSVIDQIYSNWELVIVNDGSTDDTLEIVSTYINKDSRIRIFNQPNKKQAAARNLGIRNSIGSWIAFLDADDIWENRKLEIQIKKLVEVPADIFYTGGVDIDQEGNVIRDYPTCYGLTDSREMYRILYTRNPIPILSVLIKKTLIDRVGPQDENIDLTGCEDWDYWLRVSKQPGIKFYGIDEKLFQYRLNPAGTSRNDAQMKFAQFNALYKNRDYSLMSKFQTYKSLRRILEENIYSLLIAGRLRDARLEVLRILKVKIRIRYMLLYGMILINFKVTFRYLNFIFYPNLICHKGDKFSSRKVTIK